MNRDRDHTSVLKRYFTDDQVQRLTDLTLRQLRYWEKTGVFAPSMHKMGSRPVRLYTFPDVVGLRTIAKLRRDSGISLDDVRRVSKWLAEHPAETWASLTFYVGGHRVFIKELDTEALLAMRPMGQYVFPFEMEPVVRTVAAKAYDLSERQADDIGHIYQKRSVMHNEPVIAGTRIPIVTIDAFHRAGYSTAAIIEEYPQLQEADVHAAIRESERLGLQRRSA